MNKLLQLKAIKLNSNQLKSIYGGQDACSGRPPEDCPVNHGSEEEGEGEIKD